jgi:hypothetical protein
MRQCKTGARTSRTWGRSATRAGGHLSRTWVPWMPRIAGLRVELGDQFFGVVCFGVVECCPLSAAPRPDGPAGDSDQRGVRRRRRRGVIPAAAAHSRHSLNGLRGPAVQCSQHLGAQRRRAGVRQQQRPYRCDGRCSHPRRRPVGLGAQPSERLRGIWRVRRYGSRAHVPLHGRLHGRPRVDLLRSPAAPVSCRAGDAVHSRNPGLFRRPREQWPQQQVGASGRLWMCTCAELLGVVALTERSERTDQGGRRGSCGPAAHFSRHALPSVAGGLATSGICRKRLERILSLPNRARHGAWDYGGSSDSFPGLRGWGRGRSADGSGPRIHPHRFMFILPSPL